MTNTNQEFSFPVTKNSYMIVRWARPSEDNAKKKANISCHFSVDYYVDNILVQTINSLCLRDTTSRKTQQKVTHIGSMFKTIGPSNNKVIFSNTFFPVDSYEDATEQEIQEQNNQANRRTTFIDNAIKAVEAFCNYQQNIVKKTDTVKKNTKPVSV